MAPTFAKEIDLGTTQPSFFMATNDRILVVENTLQTSNVACDVIDFGGRKHDRIPRVGVDVRCGAFGEGELVVGGLGKAARIRPGDRSVASWKLRRKLVWAMAHHEHRVGWATAASNPNVADVVFWDDLDREPTTVAELRVGPRQGWRRPVCVLHPIERERWWIASEHRLALVVVKGTPREEQAIVLPFIACQLAFASACAFALEVRGGRWQWRDGELVPPGVFVHGGSPPDPETVARDARLFRIDLASGRIDGPAIVRSGMLVVDDAGVAILTSDGIDRWTENGERIESLPFSVPPTELQHVAPMSQNGTAHWRAQRCIGPAELLLPKVHAIGRTHAEHRLVHLAWGQGVARASARHA